MVVAKLQELTDRAMYAPPPARSVVSKDEDCTSMSGDDLGATHPQDGSAAAFSRRRIKVKRSTAKPRISKQEKAGE